MTSKKKDSFEIEKENTHKAFCKPKKGDRFHEMYSHWVYVVKTTKYFVYTMHASPPCTFPKDGSVEKMTREVFKKRWLHLPTARRKVPTYFILLADRGNNVAGWLKEKTVRLYEEVNGRLIGSEVKNE